MIDRVIIIPHLYVKKMLLNDQIALYACIFFNGFSYPNLLILMSISEFNKNIPRTPVPGNHNYFSDSNSLRKCSGSVHAHIGARFLINRVLLYLLSKTKMIKIINLKVVFLCITLNIFTKNFTECSKLQYTKIHLY